MAWRTRSARYARRFLALGAYALAAFLAYQIVTTLLVDEASDAEPAPAASAPVETLPPVVDPGPQRPTSAPARIPEWAWELHAWHETAAAERGPRPESAPLPVPEWYWEWREWRLALDR